MVQEVDGLLVLVEVKGTQRRTAKEHFFSVSQTEVDAAKHVGPSRYKFVIVYDLDGRPRDVELTWDSLWKRRRSVTMQYSMRLKP